MTIAIDASRANAKERTGTEWYSFYLIQELKKIVSPSDRVILYSREALRDGLENLPSNWESKILRWPPRKLWTHTRLSWEMLWHRPDVLFVPAHVIPLIHPKKTFTTIHDIGFLRAPWLYSKFDLWYQNFALRMALTTARKIIVPSEFTKQELINVCPANPQGIKVIHHGIDYNRYHARRDQNSIAQVLQKYRLNKSYLLFLGRLEKKKNVHKLLQAFDILHADHAKLIAPYSLVLAGKSTASFSKLLNRSMHKPHKPLGFVPEKDLPFLMAGASVFVFPSLYEGFGIPLLEAMASGTAIVASNTGPLPEIAGDAAELVNPHNPRELAEGIYRVLSDNSYRHSLIAKGLERVKQFSWEKCAKETLEVLTNNSDVKSGPRSKHRGY